MTYRPGTKVMSEKRSFRYGKNRHGIVLTDGAVSREVIGTLGSAFRRLLNVWIETFFPFGFVGTFF
jgi:hypothetical protein